MRIIAGTARGTPLKTPRGMDTRPTTERVKESLFSAIQFELAGKHVLDLFAGSGQLGLEALSRGAAEAVFVDGDKNAAAVIRENIQKTGFTGNTQLICGDSIRYLKSCRKQFSLIFLDPPYQTNLLKDALETVIAFDILAPNGIIIAERPKGSPFPVSCPWLIPSKEYGFGVSAVTVLRKVNL